MSSSTLPLRKALQRIADGARSNPPHEIERVARDALTSGAGHFVAPGAVEISPPPAPAPGHNCPLCGRWFDWLGPEPHPEICPVCVRDKFKGWTIMSEGEPG